MPSNLSTLLSDEEIQVLDEFLLSDATSDETMTLDTLDGYLTAIIIGPTTILPSQWLPGIWGPTEEDSPDYYSMEQAQRILGLITRQMNGIVWMLQDDPDTFDPLIFNMTYEGEEYLNGEAWGYGFIEGIKLCRENWQPLFDDPTANEALRPIYLLGAEDQTEEEEKLTRWPAQRGELSKQIAQSVATIYRFWLPRRQTAHETFVASTIRRTEPKMGRNDPCPCGSGKKFKKCCGAEPTVH